MAIDDEKLTGYFAKSLGRLEKTVDKLDEKSFNIDKTLSLLSASFAEHLKQDEKMYEEFKNMVNILEKNTDDIRHHISRTDEVQNTNAMLQELILGINERLGPIEQDRLKKQAVREYMTEKIIKWTKISAAVGSFATLVYYVVKIKTGA